MNFANVTLGELLSSKNDIVRRNALSVLKQLQKEEGHAHIGPSEEHSKNCKTFKEYGNCPPWPHA